MVRRYGVRICVQSHLHHHGVRLPEVRLDFGEVQRGFCCIIVLIFGVRGVSQHEMAADAANSYGNQERQAEKAEHGLTEAYGHVKTLVYWEAVDSVRVPPLPFVRKEAEDVMMWNSYVSARITFKDGIVKRFGRKGGVKILVLGLFAGGCGRFFRSGNYRRLSSRCVGPAAEVLVRLRER